MGKGSGGTSSYVKPVVGFTLPSARGDLLRLRSGQAAPNDRKSQNGEDAFLLSGFSAEFWLAGACETNARPLFVLSYVLKERGGPRKR